MWKNCTFFHFYLRIPNICSNFAAFFARGMEKVLNLDSLEAGKHRYTWHFDGAYLSGIEKSELLGGELDVEADVTVKEGHLSVLDYLVNVKVNGVVQVACDRCLEPMDIAVNAEDDMTEDAQTIETQKHEIDLNWLAYELTIVNLPMVHSHQTGGCNPAMDNLLQNHLCAAEEPEEL